MDSRHLRIRKKTTKWEEVKKGVKVMPALLLLLLSHFGGRKGKRKKMGGINPLSPFVQRD